MKAVKAILLGAGNRGGFVYAEYARMNSAMLSIVAVAEPDDVKRERIRAQHGIAEEYAFLSWEDVFAAPLPPADAVIIAMQDKLHGGAVIKALENNFHILCEKPIVPTLEECRAIEKKTASFGKVFMVAHVLKYTAFFSKIKEILDAGSIGRLIGIDLIEFTGHIHYSHSFCRGAWRNKAESSPMILAKSCHDLDMLHWLAGAPCESLSSYGALNFFKSENAPKGAPRRCLDGCPWMIECPYYAPKIYLGPNTGWPVNVITTDLSLEGRARALETGPYGRCVFYCDNDVVDHQTMTAKFANGVTAAFTMSGFTRDIHRGITLFGTRGEIDGDLEDNAIRVKDFSTGHVDTVNLATPEGGHSGGDFNFISDFVRMVRDKNGAEKNGTGKNDAAHSFESHYMAFAAEESRLDSGRKISLPEFKAGTA
jgi:predicted dehydrogenase